MVGGRSAPPDTLQRSGLLSVSAARHQGRTASRSCPDRLAFSTQTRAPLVCSVIAAAVRRGSYRGDSCASAGTLKSKQERDSAERQPSGGGGGEKVTDGAEPIPGILTRISSPAWIFLQAAAIQHRPRCHRRDLRDLFHLSSWLDLGTPARNSDGLRVAA